MRRSTWILGAALAACGDAGGGSTAGPVGGGGGGGGGGADSDGGLPAHCTPALVWHVVDAWGRDIAGATLTGEGSLALGVPTSPPIAAGSVPFAVRAEAADYRPAELDLVRGAQGRWAPAASEAWVTAGRVTEAGCPVDHVFLGLDHRWFAAQALPFTAENSVALFPAPADVWRAVGESIATATRSVLYSTWWWDSEFEVARTGPLDATDEERRPDTMLARLEALGGGVKRQILVNRLLGESLPGAAFLPTDEPLRACGSAPDDQFELLLQGNHVELAFPGAYQEQPRPVDFPARVRGRHPEMDFGLATAGGAQTPTLEAASWHMKAVVVDGQMAFVQGMNTQNDYWDTVRHEVFDPRRMRFEATPEARQSVSERRALPDYRPHLDLGVRLLGPIVADVVHVLAARWAYARQEDEFFGAHATPMEEITPPAAAGTVQAQLQITQPPPDSETSILDGQLQAIAEAQDYILIVDQYWRPERLIEPLATALTERPGLHLIVVTNPVENTNGGKKWTVETDTAMRAAAGDRYLLMTLRGFDVQTPEEAGGAVGRVHTPDFYLHAKLTIVDDRYLNVGSANKNNRSLLYDGEMNVAVLDAAWVRDARRLIVEELLGQGDPADPADGAALLALLREVAAGNEGVLQAWQAGIGTATSEEITARKHGWPRGFLYPYGLDPNYVIDVGPDFY